MVEHVYRRAQAAASLADVLVATDDARIRDAVTAFGGRALMTAARHRSGTERLAEAARDLRCDIVVNVQADEPLLAASAIDRAVAALRDTPAAPMSTVHCKLRDPENSTTRTSSRCWWTARPRAVLFAGAAVPGRPAGGDVPRGVYRHVGLYAYRREFLLRIAALEPTPLELAERLEQLRVLEHGYGCGPC